MSDILQGFAWNEADGDSIGDQHEGLLSILAFTPDRSPRLIGTAFIVSAEGDSATAITAAHNLEGVREAQSPKRPTAPSALSEFLPERDVKVDPKSLRAIYQCGDRITFCCVSVSTWDVASDIAVLALTPEQPDDVDLFRAHYRLTDAQPTVGDVVAVLGYAGMETVKEYRDGAGYEEATLARRLVLRAGRVAAVHPDGHIFSRAPCLETTIPVFGGMSGGPAFLVPEPGSPILPFGLITSDPETDPEEKNDRSQPGNTVISLLPLHVETVDPNRQIARLRLKNIRHAVDPEAPQRSTKPYPFLWEPDRGE
jgi:hypothetical protein